MVSLARSKSPFGEFEPCPNNPILTHRNEMDNPIAGTGHADLVQAYDGSWWMVFLAYRQSESYFHHLGRETFLCPAEWKDGWLKVNGGIPVTLNMDCPTLPPHPFTKPSKREDFHHGIGPEWNYLRNPDRKNYSFGEDGLILTGSEHTLDDNASPTFIARRQEQFKGIFCARLKPVKLSEGAQTGLTVFYGPENHYDFYVTTMGICLKKTIGDLSAVVFHQPWQGECELEISFDRLMYRFAFSKPGESKQAAGTALTRYVSTEATPCSFTGVYLGAYAQGDCTCNFRWIDCDWENSGSQP
jgi:alpha-N-arabinofuranosidase